LRINADVASIDLTAQDRVRAILHSTVLGLGLLEAAWLSQYAGQGTASAQRVRMLVTQ
jgi:hypothetical protein